MGSSLEATPEFRGYIAALRDVFYGMPWEKIAEQASRIWHRCGLSERVPWVEAREIVKHAFQAYDRTRYEESFSHQTSKDRQFDRHRLATPPVSKRIH